jgi:hypothetical protein
MSGTVHEEIYNDYRRDGNSDDMRYVTYLEARVFFYKVDSERRVKEAECRMKSVEALKPSHNTASREIAVQLGNAVSFLPVDGSPGVREARAIVNDCIAQLQA